MERQPQTPQKQKNPLNFYFPKNSKLVIAASIFYFFFKLHFGAKTLKAIGYKIIAATPQEASRSVGIITLNFSLKRKVKIFFKGQFILVGWLKPPPK